MIGEFGFMVFLDHVLELQIY
jgi:hypothetical protein